MPLRVRLSYVSLSRDLNLRLPPPIPPDTLIAEMEKNSGVSFHQAQVALARQWVGNDQGQSRKTVVIKKPQETTEGLNVTEKTEVKTEEVPLPATVEEAKEIIEKFERGSDAIRGDEQVADNVVQHMLCDKTVLQDEKWYGTEEEERAS